MRTPLAPLSIALIVLFLQPQIGVADESTPEVDAQLTSFVIETSRPHLGVARGWSSRPIDVLLRMLSDEKNETIPNWTERQSLKLQSELGGYLDRTEKEPETDELLGELAPSRRQFIMDCLLLIEGISQLANASWQERLNLSNSTINRINQIERSTKSEKSGPLHASFFVRPPDVESIAELTASTISINTHFGMSVVQILKKDEKERLARCIARAKANSGAVEKLIDEHFEYSRGFDLRRLQPPQTD